MIDEDTLLTNRASKKQSFQDIRDLLMFVFNNPQVFHTDTVSDIRRALQLLVVTVKNLIIS